jgi:hypothetical protein
MSSELSSPAKSCVTARAYWKLQLAELFRCVDGAHCFMWQCAHWHCFVVATYRTKHCAPSRQLKSSVSEVVMAHEALNTVSEEQITSVGNYGNDHNTVRLHNPEDWNPYFTCKERQYCPQITSWSPQGMRVLRQCTVPRAEVMFVTIQHENSAPQRKKWTRLLQCLNCPMFAIRPWITTSLCHWPVRSLPSTCVLCTPPALQ